MTRLRALLPLLMLLAAAALLLQLTLRSGGSEQTIAGSSAEQAPQYIANQATWVRYGPDGQPELRAQAERIDYFEDRSMKLSVVALDRLGGKAGYWHVSAPLGIVPAGEQRMQLQPEVAISGTPRADLPTEIAASQVWVDWQQHELYSDQPLHAKAPGRTVTADSWRSDFNGQSVQMNGRVEVNYDAPSPR